jgi:hypothetical protein
LQNLLPEAGESLERGKPPAAVCGRQIQETRQCHVQRR